MEKTKEQLRKEFNLFAQKIAQLETLRKELNSLNTKGFESDAALIRARLKDVSSVSWIKEKIAELRVKIEKKSNKNGLIGTRVLRETKKIERDTEGIKRRIKELENILQKKKSLSGKKILSKEESDAIKDIPQIEQQLRALRIEFEAHEGRHRVKIDSGVGTLVDSKFDDFIDEIKAELSERVRDKETKVKEELAREKREADRNLAKEKREVTGELKKEESEMEKALKDDLRSRKELFEKKYNDVVEEFHEKYKKKLHDELHREVRKNFNQQLNERLQKEKHKIVLGLLEENAKKLHSDREKLVSRLGSEYSKKNEKLSSKMKYLDKQKSDLISEKESFERKIRAKITDVAKEKQRIISGMKRDKSKAGLMARAQRVRLERMRKRELKRLESLRKRVAIESEKSRRQMNKRLLNKKKKIDVLMNTLNKEGILREKQFASKVNQMKREMHNELMKRALSLEERSREEIKKELAKRENELRSQLDREYSEKAKSEMMKNKARLEAKKELLQKHILEQARRLLD